MVRIGLKQLFSGVMDYVGIYRYDPIGLIHDQSILRVLTNSNIIIT